MNTMTNEEKEQWMLLFTTSPDVISLHEYTVAYIKSVLNMEHQMNFNITENFWVDNEDKYLNGEMYVQKIPITNLRDRLNAVEVSEKNKLFNHLKKEN
jgi:hypothetical protein